MSAQGQFLPLVAGLCLALSNAILPQRPDCHLVSIPRGPFVGFLTCTGSFTQEPGSR